MLRASPRPREGAWYEGFPRGPSSGRRDPAGEGCALRSERARPRFPRCPPLSNEPGRRPSIRGCRRRGGPPPRRFVRAPCAGGPIGLPAGARTWPRLARPRRHRSLPHARPAPRAGPHRASGAPEPAPKAFFRPLSAWPSTSCGSISALARASPAPATSLGTSLVPLGPRGKRRCIERRLPGGGRVLDPCRCSGSPTTRARGHALVPTLCAFPGAATPRPCNRLRNDSPHEPTSGMDPYGSDPLVLGHDGRPDPRAG